MQQSVARLTKEITSLKASLDAANRSASSQIAKISERLNRETANITGSLTPQTSQVASSAPLPAARLEPAANAAASVDRNRLDDPRNPRRLRLRAGARRRLSGRARRAAAGPRSGRTDQATGRSLAGRHAQRTSSCRCAIDVISNNSERSLGDMTNGRRLRAPLFICA